MKRLADWISLQVRAYAEEDYAQILSYQLPEEQAIYTSMPQNIVETFSRDERNLPFVVYARDNLVGCFALHTRQAHMYGIENPHALLLKSFSIDARYQKRGHALETLRALPDLTKQYFPDKNEIVLTVHYTNAPARLLYLKAGFLDKGLRYEGEYGEELIFHYAL